MSKLVVLLGSMVFVCAIAGYAIAGSMSATPKKIQACSKKKGGALRIAKKCRKGERRLTWSVTGQQGSRGAAGPQGQSGANGTNGTSGTSGTNGTNGTNGNSTGETYFSSAGAGSNFGGGGTCDATPSGPSITFSAPSGSYAQVMASTTSQRTGGTSNTVCVRVDGTDVQFSSSNSLAADTRYLQQGSAAGVTDPLTARPLTFPVSAGSHTISLRYGSAGGTSQFSNRNLYVTVFHPTS
jgi:hypothetical protein